jgi:hypothetical protein
LSDLTGKQVLEMLNREWKENKNMRYKTYIKFLEICTFLFWVETLGIAVIFTFGFWYFWTMFFCIVKRYNKNISNGKRLKEWDFIFKLVKTNV